jgi:CII-binding regulator of phage lambda lysogenization HflD
VHSVAATGAESTKKSTLLREVLERNAVKTFAVFGSKTTTLPSNCGTWVNRRARVERLFPNEV